MQSRSQKPERKLLSVFCWQTDSKITVKKYQKGNYLEAKRLISSAM